MHVYNSHLKFPVTFGERGLPGCKLKSAS